MAWTYTNFLTGQLLGLRRLRARKHVLYGYFPRDWVVLTALFSYKDTGRVFCEVAPSGDNRYGASFSQLSVQAKESDFSWVDNGTGFLLFLRARFPTVGVLTNGNDCLLLGSFQLIARFLRFFISSRRLLVTTVTVYNQARGLRYYFDPVSFRSNLWFEPQVLTRQLGVQVIASFFFFVFFLRSLFLRCLVR